MAATEAFMPFEPTVGSVFRLLASALAAMLAMQMVKLIYGAYFGPLSKIPGPKFAAISRIPLFCMSALGVRWKWIAYELVPKFGTTIRMGPQGVIFGDRDSVKQILLTEDPNKDELYKVFQFPNSKVSLFSATDRAVHKQRRRVLSPAFSIRYLTSLDPIIRGCVSDLVEHIEHELSESVENTEAGKIIDMYKNIHNTTLDVIGDTAFGMRFNAIKTGHHQLSDVIFKNLRSRALLFYFPFMKFYVSRTIPQGFENLIKERRSNATTQRKDILQMLFDAHKDGIDLTDDEIFHQAAEFLVAGSDTTSFSTSMALILLVKHPKKLAKLVDELCMAVPTISRDNLPHFDTLKSLQYLNAVINETMRLWPVGLDTATVRCISKDTVIGGYVIPEGTKVGVNIHSLHHNPEYWGPDVEEFLPERWLDESRIARDAYYPFSAGTRNCIGQNFAMLEMRLILASLLLLFEFEDVPNQAHDDIVQFITPNIRNRSYNLRVRRRVIA